MNNILILGAKGMLGGQLMKRATNSTGWDREDIDVLKFDDLKLKMLNLEHLPDAVINCVAYNDVDKAEENPEIAMELNGVFLGKLAGLCKELGVPLVHFSSNYVFDGQAGEYGEDSAVSPLSQYGKSKVLGEQLLSQNTDQYYLVRTAVLFGPKGESELSKKSFIELMIGLSEKQQEIKAVNDEINSLTLVTDLADTVKYLLDQKMPFGIYHVVNSGEASWFDFAKEIFFVLKKDISLIPVPSSEFPRAAQRPKRAVLLNTKLPKLQAWPDAVKEFLIKEYIAKRTV